MHDTFTFRPFFILLVWAALTEPIPHVRAAQAAPAVSGSIQPVVEVAAFGAAPVARPDGSHQTPAVYASTAGSTEGPAAAQGDQQELETRVNARESWPELLNRVGGKLKTAILTSAAVTRDLELLPALSAGKYVHVRFEPEAQIVNIDYVVDEKEAYSILLTQTGIDAKREAADPRLIEKMRLDPSKASLFTAADAVGLPEEIVLQIAGIFSDDVDFFRELGEGYRCAVAYEARFREGHIEGAGRVLAAEFRIGDRRINAYYFDEGNGRSGYFSDSGISLKKTFRKSPVEFSRITSGYTLARLHPILGIWRAHRGIDYAAPLGSNVLAVADGMVNFMGSRGELGNLIILKHFGRYETYYGHLSGFAKNLAVGQVVRKGEIIGRVGMTGLATGPHVHYEFRIDDASGHWISVPVPKEVKAAPIRSAAFKRAVEAYRTMLQIANQSRPVVLD